MAYEDKVILQSSNLREDIDKYFNDSELRTLCFDLGVDYEIFPDSGKTNNVRELISHLERRGQLPKLVEACRKSRPNHSWFYTSSKQESPSEYLEQGAEKTLFIQMDRTSSWRGEKYYGKFIGHEDDLNSLLHQLSQDDEPTLLAITAIGGMGKTAFCRELVERAYRQKLFTAIVWVRVRVEQLGSYGEPGRQLESRLTVDAAIRDIAMELEVAHWQTLEPMELRKQVSKLLARKRCLIVIDGLEDSESPQSLSRELRQIIGCSCVIINSRQQVGIAAIDFKLRKLTSEESKQFILQVSSERYALPVQNPLTYATKSQIKAIIKTTDGMPLALKLVISQASFLTLDRIIQRLSDIDEEQQLYSYIFEDSWAEMEMSGAEIAQQLLVLLASRSRPVPISLIYGIQGLSESDVDNGLQALRELSLVEYAHHSGQVQVGLHSFTKQFVNETLRPRYM